MKIVLAAALIILTLAFGACVWFYWFDTDRYEIVQPGILYRAGFSDMRRFENAWRQRPFKCVFNLHSDAELLRIKEEVALQRAFCKEHSIAWLRVPIAPKTAPSQQQSEEFSRVLRDAKMQPAILLDSGDGLSTGMFAAIWQKEGMGYDFEKCLASMKLFGGAEMPELREFIKRMYHKL